SPRSGPETVRKRSSPSGSNTDASRSAGALTSRASSRPRRQLKIISEPSDHHRPSSGSISSEGGSSGTHGSAAGASSSSAASSNESPVSAAFGHGFVFVNATAPMRSRPEYTSIDMNPGKP